MHKGEKVKIIIIGSGGWACANALSNSLFLLILVYLFLRGACKCFQCWIGHFAFFNLMCVHKFLILMMFHCTFWWRYVRYMIFSRLIPISYLQRSSISSIMDNELGRFLIHSQFILVKCSGHASFIADFVFSRSLNNYAYIYEVTFSGFQ